MARKFFFVCAGLLCLAIAFHLGASSAGAQAPSNSVVAVIGGTCPNFSSVVVTANGDLYGSNYCSDSWAHIGNVFSGGPVNVEKHTLGELKARFR